MMLPVGIWITLAAAALWFLLPTRWHTRGVRLFLNLAVVAGVVTPLVWPTATMDSAWLWGAAAVWWLCHQFAAGSDRALSTQVWGRYTAVLAGLQGLVVAEDLVTWVLALELTRFGTAIDSDDSQELADHSCRWLLVAGVVGWLGVTGTISFSESRQILDLTYAVPVGGSALGRPSIVLVGSLALMVCGLIAPVLLTACRPVPTTSPSIWWSSLAGRELAAGAALMVWLKGGLTGLETPVVVLVMVAVLCAWGFAVRNLADGQRLDFNLTAISLVTWSIWLLTTICFLGKPTFVETPGALVTSLIPDRLIAMTVFHWTLAQGGLLLGTLCLLLDRPGPWYRDQLRGLGQLAPQRAVLFLVTLASLTGFPLTWGFWTQLVCGLSLLGIHVAGNNDLVLSHFGLRSLAIISGLMLAATLACGGRMARLLILESPVGRDLPAHRFWHITWAVAISLALVIVGVVPRLLHP
ncbi:hypothetical protein GC163_07065 [bacterium]|nr:hypothetical protein [bacterium]